MILSHVLPELANAIAKALREKAMPAQAAELATAKLERWTYDAFADAGYIYLAQEHPVQHGETPAARTVAFTGEEWFNVDLRASGAVFGIELLSHEGVFQQLRSYESGRR